jgi:hypothetical protein
MTINLYSYNFSCSYFSVEAICNVCARWVSAVMHNLARYVLRMFYCN